jgi:hypothetical protein
VWWGTRWGLQRGFDRVWKGVSQGLGVLQGFGTSVIIEMEREREYICVVGHQVGFAKGF